MAHHAILGNTHLVNIASTFSGTSTAAQLATLLGVWGSNGKPVYHTVVVNGTIFGQASGFPPVSRAAIRFIGNGTGSYSPSSMGKVHILSGGMLLGKAGAGGAGGNADSAALANGSNGGAGGPAMDVSGLATPNYTWVWVLNSGYIYGGGGGGGGGGAAYGTVIPPNPRGGGGGGGGAGGGYTNNAGLGGTGAALTAGTDGNTSTGTNGNAGGAGGNAGAVGTGGSGAAGRQVGTSGFAGAAGSGGAHVNGAGGAGGASGTGINYLSSFGGRFRVDNAGSILGGTN